MFPHAKSRVFIRLRMVFIKTSAHFRPQANGSPNTLARRAERRYMESPFRCPTQPQTGLATAKTTASAHGLPFPCTDATIRPRPRSQPQSLRSSRHSIVTTLPQTLYRQKPSEVYTNLLNSARPDPREHKAGRKARNLQINDDLLILQRDKTIPTYCCCLYGDCPSDWRGCGLSCAFVQEEKEGKGEGDRRTGETEARYSTGRRIGMHCRRQ